MSNCKMWSFLLLFSLFCSSCHGSVTCKNNNGHDVDWYILYKAPEISSSRLTGSEFLYIDPEKKERLNNINSPQGVLARTLQPLFKPIREMEPSFGFISYSDQPPGCSADPKKFGHSKGVVMVDRTSTGVWLLHSTPQFPFRREQSSFWPQSGNKNAQTYICVTFNYDQFSVIGRHLKKIHIFPFEHYIPNDFHRELQDAVKWTEGATPVIPDYTVESLTFRRKEFKIFSKANSEDGDEEVGDLYISIAKNLRSDVYAQTWGCQRDRTEDYCPREDFKVTNVEELSISSLGAWKPTADHSKWCVAVDQNKHWTCIADVNRAISQFKRFGGAICINDQRVHNEFRAFTRLPTCRKRPYPLPPECGSISDDGSLHFLSG